MGTTLSNGVYLPDEGERNCYAGLKVNWEILNQKVADISALQLAIAGALHREIVASLPTTDIDPNTIYMILSGTSATENMYNEYMYVNNAWELIGTSATDLTNYYTKAEVDGKLLLKANASDLTSHTGDTTIHVTASDKTKWTNSANTHVLRLAKSALTPSTSDNSFSNLDDSTALKVGDKVIDPNGVLYEVTAVDTTNETFTIGTAIDAFAKNSNVMHLSGNETAPGKKTFADLTTFNSWLYFTNTAVTKGTIPQSTVNPYRIYFGSGINYGASLFNIDTTVSNTGVQTLTLRSAENVVGGDDTRFVIVYDPNLTQPRYIGFKGDCLPNENNTYDCGNLSLAWKNVNSYLLSSYGFSTGDEYSSNTRTNLWLMGNRDTKEVSGILFDSYRQNIAQGTGNHILGIGIKENSVRYEGCRWGWYWDNDLNGYTFDFKPTMQGANQAVKHNLGTSTEKWDTINGINPGALSLPDLNNGIDISGYLTNAGTTTPSEYTPTVNGWLVLKVGATSGVVSMRAYSNSGLDNYAYSERSDICDTSGSSYARFTSMTIPCVANDKQNIIISTNTSIVSAKFFPCLGNV